jgi:hypothetical protein
MNYLLLIEWGNCDKTFESFQSRKDAEKQMDYYKLNSSIEYMELVLIEETCERWSNPDCCSEEDFR